MLTYENLNLVRTSYSFARIPTDPESEFQALQNALSSVTTDPNLEVPCDFPSARPATESEHIDTSEVTEETSMPSSVTQTGNQCSIADAKTFAADYDKIRTALANGQPLATDSNGTAITNDFPRASSLGTPESVRQQGNISSVSEAKEFAGDKVLIPAEAPEVTAPAVETDIYNRIHFNTPPSNSSLASSISSSNNVDCVAREGNLDSVSSAEEFAAEPWYKKSTPLKNAATGTNYPYTGKELYASEVKLMNQKYPKAKLYTLDTQELYWVLPLEIDIGRTKTSYTVMLKYDNNHPHPNDWGGSCKAIFLSPDINQINDKIRRKKGPGCCAPHVLSLPGSQSEKYLCAISKDEQSRFMRSGEVQSAAAVAARVARYLNMLEISLADEGTKEGTKVWQDLCKG